MQHYLDAMATHKYYLLLLIVVCFKCSELTYHDKERDDHEKHLTNLNDEQIYEYDMTFDVVIINKEGMFFFYGYGETGKTYIFGLLYLLLLGVGVL